MAFLDRRMVMSSIREAFIMLKPAVQFKNPVMFVTYIGAIVTTLCVVEEMFNDSMLWFDVAA